MVKDTFASSPAARHCCYVIPSRLAFFVFSVIIFLFAIGFGAVGWVIADKLGMSSNDKTGIPSDWPHRQATTRNRATRLILPHSDLLLVGNVRGSWVGCVH